MSFQEIIIQVKDLVKAGKDSEAREILKPLSEKTIESIIKNVKREINYWHHFYHNIIYLKRRKNASWKNYRWKSKFDRRSS